MITLYRWILLKLAFYQLIDKYVTTIINDPEDLEKKILPYLAEIIHNTNSDTK